MFPKIHDWVMNFSLLLVYYGLISLIADVIKLIIWASNHITIQ